MTPEKQQRAIEKACGWIIANPENDRPDYRHWTPPGCVAKHNHMYGDKPPNYLADLNSMHEAKKVLCDKGLMLEFVNQLVGIVCSAMGFRWDKVTADDHLILIANATAEQEAEAFLRVMGLWEEDAQ